MLDIWRYLLCWPWRYPYAGVAGTEAGSVVEDSLIVKRDPGTAASRCQPGNELDKPGGKKETRNFPSEGYVGI
jgi:hypothetical protein